MALAWEKAGLEPQVFQTAKGWKATLRHNARGIKRFAKSVGKRNIKKAGGQRRQDREMSLCLVLHFELSFLSKVKNNKKKV